MEFPAGAKMRSVTLQGYFTQSLGAAGSADDVARHAISVVKSVTGDAVRRKVVDATKCASCHEWFEGHGGNRVIGRETGSNAELVCVTCHVPNMATSGHTITDAQWSARNAAAVNTSAGWSSDQLRIFGEWGVDMLLTPNTALQPNMPRVTNNFKDMIHGIHAGRDRVVPFKDARNFRGNATLLDFRRMDFPGNLNNCQGCHVANTYSNVPAKALLTNHYFRSDAFLLAPDIAGATSSMLQTNPQDVTTTPFAGACVSCHDATAAKSHMELNGAKVNRNRSEAVTAIEACAVCHGPGATWDPVVVHK